MVRRFFSMPAVFSFFRWSSSIRPLRNDRLDASVKRLTAREMSKNCLAERMDLRVSVIGLVYMKQSRAHLLSRHRETILQMPCTTQFSPLVLYILA